MRKNEQITKEQLKNKMMEMGEQVVDFKAVETIYRQSEEKMKFERLHFMQICDGIEDYIYVADPATHEILYANSALMELYRKDLIGGICYRDLQGLESPCYFCTNEIILKDKGEPYKWEFYNKFLNRHFMIVDKIIKWPDGRDVRLELAVDITEQKSSADAVRRRMEFIDTIRKISSRFVRFSDFDGAINQSLADIGILSKAGRAYLFFFREDGAAMDNTHEWCAKGVSPQKDMLQNLPTDVFPWWVERLRKGEVIHVTDVSKLPLEAKAEKEILEMQEIKSLLVLPLHVKGKLSGFIGFDNVAGTGSWSDSDLSLLRVSSEIIGSTIERKLFEEALRESDDKYRAIFENTGTAMAIIEEDTTISLVNAEFEKISGYFKNEINGIKKWPEFVKEHLDVTKKRNAFPQSYESQIIDRGNNKKDVIVTVARLPGTKKMVVSLLDITERKRMEKQLKYLGFHDVLTGLYNRAYFEEEMYRLEDGRNLPVGIIICDLDGLKLVNDTLGHDVGDELLVAAANVIKKCFRKKDIIARIGGDEFAVILPKCNKTIVERACRKIRDAAAKYNEASPKCFLNVSVGFAIKNETGASISMVELFKEADNSMNREKLHHAESSRSAVVQALTRALAARDFITEGHAERLQSMVVGLARAVGFSEQKISDLRLLAQFHDIGKVGISDSILFKPGPFTPAERTEMQRHSAIGHRIALSAPDLVPIAEWIEKHHEWWNGKGYPYGLKGEDIPLECRILAVSDAYDVMTSDRPYRKAVSKEEAIAELKRCSGTQFDPDLVDKFIEIVKNEK